MLQRLFALLMLSFLVSCDWLETSETYYKDYESAAKAGAISRGWIPTFVPSSAIEIRLKYDVENNRTWLYFRAKIGRDPSVLESCNVAAQSKVTYPSTGPRGWWPAVLIADSRERKTEYEYYICKDGEVMAVNHAQGEAFLWRLAK